MAFENEPQQQEESAISETTGDDLASALGGAEVAFVSEEKKPLNTSTLIMGGFLLACGIGTYFMYNRNATARTAPTAESAAAQSTITQFLSDDKANVNRMKDLLENTEKAVSQFKNAPGKAQVPIEDLQTNPFRFAQSDQAEAPAEDVDAVTARKREEAARAATIKAAQALNLQFIVSGRKKSCMINNARYVEGDKVGDFTIDSISSDAVVIARGDAKFELRMKK